MSPEVLRLLQQFDVPMNVGIACFHAFGQTKHFAAPRWIMDAVYDGTLARVGDSELPLDNSEKIYHIEFLLTDKGLSACGLPPRTKQVAKPKSRTLFDLE